MARNGWYIPSCAPLRANHYSPEAMVLHLKIQQPTVEQSVILLEDGSGVTVRVWEA